MKIKAIDLLFILSGLIYYLFTFNIFNVCILFMLFGI